MRSSSCPRSRPTFGRCLAFAAILLAGSLAVTQSAHAADDDKPVREIFVPFDDLNLLLEGDAQRAAGR